MDVGLWAYLTVLWRALQMAVDHCGSLNKVVPRQFILLVDGGSENWNRTVPSLGCYLVFAGCFDSVLIFRSPPGHGHTPLDAAFGALSRYMHGTRNVTGSSARRGKNIFTPYQLRFAVQDSKILGGTSPVSWI